MRRKGKSGLYYSHRYHCLPYYKSVGFPACLWLLGFGGASLESFHITRLGSQAFSAGAGVDKLVLMGFHYLFPRFSKLFPPFVGSYWLARVHFRITTLLQPLPLISH